MPANKSQHFVPQHYLRQFRIQRSKQICVATISPYRFIERAAISGQCQQDYIYRDDGKLDELLQQCEQDLAPVLIRVSQERQFTLPELEALRLFAVVLHVRTRRVIEDAKVFPKHVAAEFVKAGIERGDLPEPPSGWDPTMIDFRGMAGTLVKEAGMSCWLEMQTLGCKLLEAGRESAFVTSDNPVVLLNQLFAAFDRYRSYVGFSRSGFQLLLPISPQLCLFFYDPKVYKVGGRRQMLVTLEKADVELINSLQVQTAENCIYFHSLELELEVRKLILNYSDLRRPAQDSLSVIPGRREGESLIHVRKFSAKVRRPWKFCKLLKTRRIGEDSTRNPSWSAFVAAVMDDVRANPGRDVLESMNRLLGHPFSKRDLPTDNS